MPAVLSTDQSKEMPGCPIPPPNCEKQFGGDTSLWILIIERFTGAIGFIHGKDLWAAVHI